MITADYPENCGIDRVSLDEIISLFPADEKLHVTLTPAEHSVKASAPGRQITVRLREDSVKKTAKHALYAMLSTLTGTELSWGSMTGVKPLKKYQTLFLNGVNEDEIGEFFSHNYAVSTQKIRLMRECFAVQKKYLYPKSDHACLYINIPICPSKCAYCSFPSKVSFEGSEECEIYFAALLKELNSINELQEELKLKFDCVYVGGGTPSILTSSQIAKLLERVNQIAPDAGELTFEAGRADTLNKEKLRVLKDNKVSRLSLNPQTTNAQTLKKINRNTAIDEFLRMYAAAQSAGFSDINCDLILGLESETEADFEKSVNDVISLSPSCITLHTLCKKRTSELDASLIKNPRIDIAKYHDTARGFLKEAGYRPYYLYKQKNALTGAENTGYCKSDRECVYNIQMMSGLEHIISAGAGAASKIIGENKTRPVSLYNPKDIKTYVDRIEAISAGNTAVIRGNIPPK